MDKSLKEIVPLNLGGKLPAQVEHITNHVITYPQKEGFDLFSTRGISESNNYKVLDVQAAIGKILPSPPDIIRGSVFPNLQSKDFIPKKLDKNEYNTLKVYTNTVELKYKGKNMNIREAINAEIDSDYVQVRLSSIKKFGLDSEEGKRFSEEVFQVLSKINTKFIKAGMIEYMLNEMPEEDRNNRINAVENKNIKYNDILLEEFERLNLGTFSNSSF